MATLAPSLRKKKTQRKTAPAKPDEQKKARKPAYLKRKMAVSQPQDQEEKEADQVAKEVARAPREEPEPGPKEDKTMISSKPVPSAQRLLQRVNRIIARQAEPEEEEEPVQTKLRRNKKDDDDQVATVRRSVETEEREEETAQRMIRRKAASSAPAVEQEEQPLAAKLFRQRQIATSLNRKIRRVTQQSENEAQQIQTRLWRAVDDESEQQQENESVSNSDGETTETSEDSVKPSVEERIAQSRGMGSPLPPKLLNEMENKFGQDLSSVTLHSDTEAAELSKELNARAFTVGNDIYFAPGEFAPETEAGRELLAHELTHVVQQTPGNSIQRRIDPTLPDTYAESGNSAAKLRELETLKIPAVKARHLPLYSFLAQPPDNKLGRIHAYDRQGVNQRSVWNSSVRVSSEAIRQRLQALPNLPPTDNQRFSFKVHGHAFNRSINQLKNARLLKIPNWDRQGRDCNFDVDHIVELQISGQHGGGVGNSIENMELLDHNANITSGATIKSGIYNRLNEYLATLRPPMGRDDFLATHDVVFESVVAERGPASSAWWSKSDIESAEPLRDAEQEQMESAGAANLFILTSGPGGVEVGRFRHDAAQNTINPGRPASRSLAGMEINSIVLNNLTGAGEGSSTIGTINARWDLPAAWAPAQPEVTLALQADGDYRGYPSSIPALSLDFRHLSPVNFSSISIEDGELYAEGQLTPSINLFNAPILVLVQGRDITFSLEYGVGDIALPVPGITIDDAAVSVFYSTERGLGLGGQILFSIPNAGNGNLAVTIASSGGVNLEGGFTFDRKLFDRAHIDVWYRNNQFGGSGTIGIDQPDKIKGIRSANITASYNEGAFSAEGSVQPDIPGVEQAGLTVAYSEADGLTIGGNLQLTANPAIRSGSIDVTVNKQGEEWKVSATGTAQPAIPGIDSQLTVGYDDGAFTAEFSGGYRRGMLSGTVTVGATNRAVGEDGRPSGEPMEGGAINIYGSGSATVQIAPWLQGTAGIRFDPNGEVTVSGEIGIPNNVEIFARREINRSLFNIAVQVPIVPGIVAEVGGGLTAVAGIGPGVIDQLRIGITYNPAHEEDTRVTGDAHLRVPADAGLRLSVRAGIGLGITGASATGGLEIGGTLGIEGAAEAGVHIDWTPTEGLDLTANLSVHAQPSFTFDISGYVSVRALGFSVYDERWQLASYQFGSDYRFGISLPVHYHEGEPFDISLDDVQFEVPDISPNQILRGLIDRIA